MSNINNLERQHIEIKNSVNELKGLFNSSDIQERAFEASKIVNTLAGMLKVHLSSEDKYLYPRLLKSEDIKVRTTAENFDNEMKGLFNAFTEFKVKYNTSKKITSDIDGFKREGKSVVTLLENRINKEDAKLFPLIK